MANTKKSVKTIDAQKLRLYLELVAKKIGKRKRIGIAEAFELVCKCTAN